MSIFAWKPADMPGVPRHLIEHKLNVNEGSKPTKQRLRRFASDKKKAIEAEITRLLAARFIKEVYHPDWLANPVLVKKKNKEWRMCVDYTDLNKCCPKDPFGLPRIDEVVDNSTSYEVLSFLDCYSGYHQISLNEADQIKTSLITPFGAYCYITMPFGLKNAGATYQRAIQACLKKLIPDTVQAYIDDVVVKTVEADNVVEDLKKTFKALNEYQWKLNPSKCIFRASSGILLGNVISLCGIEPNPEKIQAILHMKPPKNVKDI